MSSFTRTSDFGVGDFTFRVKHRLPRLWDIASSAQVEMQVPSGRSLFFRGTGDYWITPGLSFRRMFGKDRADLTLNIGVISMSAIVG